MLILNIYLINDIYSILSYCKYNSGITNITYDCLF